MTRKQDERDVLRAALADEQARLRRLELEQGVARALIAELGQRLEAIEEHPTPTDESTNQPTNEPRTPAEKVTLFRRLFRGRPDVYPIRFASKTARMS